MLILYYIRTQSLVGNVPPKADSLRGLMHFDIMSQKLRKPVIVFIILTAIQPPYRAYVK